MVCILFVFLVSLALHKVNRIQITIPAARAPYNVGQASIMPTRGRIKSALKGLAQALALSNANNVDTPIIPW